MVMMSNWPPLVAISVVTRWRSTFSSSVTHFTVISGFLAVNSPVNACMRIMSGLLTVAMVSVVCAIEGAEPNRVTAPSRAPRTCFTVTSLVLTLSICPRLAIMFTPSCNVVKDKIGSCGPPWRCIAGGPEPAPGASRFATPRRIRRKKACPGSLLFQDGAGGRLVGDQTVDQTSLQRRSDRRNLGGTDGCADGQGPRGDLRRNAGEAAVGAAVDDMALGVERPAGQLADRAQSHHFQQLLARDETVNMELRALVHLANPDQPQVGLGRHRPHLGDRIYLEHLVALACGRHQKWQRHRIMPRLGAVGEPPDGVEATRRTDGREVFDQRYDLMIGAIDRRNPLDRGPHRPAGAERHDGRLLGAQRRLQNIGGPLGHFGRWQPRCGIGRHHFAVGEMKQVLEPRG